MARHPVIGIARARHVVTTEALEVRWCDQQVELALEAGDRELAGLPLGRRSAERALEAGAAGGSPIPDLDDVTSPAHLVRVAVAAGAVDDDRVRRQAPAGGATSPHPLRSARSHRRPRNPLDQDETSSSLVATNAVRSASDSNPTTAHA